MAKRSLEGVHDHQESDKKQRTTMDKFRIVNQPSCLFPDHRGGPSPVLFVWECQGQHWVCKTCVVTLLTKNYEVSGLQAFADKCPTLRMSFTGDVVPCARCFSGISEEGKETRALIDVRPDLKFITPMCSQVSVVVSRISSVSDIFKSCPKFARSRFCPLRLFLDVTNV
jgi:hypothetical protein